MEDNLLRSFSGPVFTLLEILDPFSQGSIVVWTWCSSTVSVSWHFCLSWDKRLSLFQFLLSAVYALSDAIPSWTEAVDRLILLCSFP